MFELGLGFCTGIELNQLEVVAPTLHAAQICQFPNFISLVSHPGYLLHAEVTVYIQASHQIMVHVEISVFPFDM
jgi:hypothetical protein